VFLSISAFVCEYVDSTLGMGYGTMLTPLLLIVGYKPLEVVPAILFSECVTGIVAGILHHRVGNASFQKHSPDTAVVAILAITGIVGVSAAALINISLSAHLVKWYICVMLFGIVILLWFRRESAPVFSWRGIAGIGLLSAFNKGISGGGYGPLVTGGQMIAGRRDANAIGSTSLAEGIVCFGGLCIYTLTIGWPDWHIALPLAGGAVLSTPISVISVRLLAQKGMLRRIVTIVVGILAVLYLAKLLYSI